MRYIDNLIFHSNLSAEMRSLIRVKVYDFEAFPFGRILNIKSRDREQVYEGGYLDLSHMHR